MLDGSYPSIITLSASNDLMVHLLLKTMMTIIKESQKPIFVKFWASWCGGCKEMAPAYEQTAKRYKEKIIFAEFNIDQNRRFAVTKGIKAIPTVVLYKDGQELDRITMTLNTKQLEFWADEALKKEYRFKKKKN